MSYINLIQLEVATARASVPVAVANPPRLIWAELNILGFIGHGSLAVAAFSSLAWMFVSC